MASHPAPCNICDMPDDLPFKIAVVSLGLLTVIAVSAAVFLR
jgi:hypothetical protein